MYSKEHHFFKTDRRSSAPADLFLNTGLTRLHYEPRSYEPKFFPNCNLPINLERKMEIGTGIFSSQSHFKRSNSLLTFSPSPGLKNAAVDLGLQAVELKIPGLGSYLHTKVELFHFTENVFYRVSTKNKDMSNTEKVTCALIGSGAKTATSIVGNAALHTAATKITVETLGLAALARGALIASGNELLEPISTGVGDCAEDACHAAFWIKQQLGEGWESLTNSNAPTP